MLNTVSESFKNSGSVIEHSFFKARPIKKRGILILSSDKGLCGPLNSNLFRLVSESVQEEAVYFTVGRKGAQFIKRSGLDLKQAFEVSDKVEVHEFIPVVEALVDAYESEAIDTIEIAYPNFINVLVQKPVIQPILPIIDLEMVLEQLKSKIKGFAQDSSLESREMSFEPSPADILSQLPSLYLRFMVSQLILESKASEYSARMVAMKSATDNASKLVDALTLDYNKARQAAITQEILEIAAASAA